MVSRREKTRKSTTASQILTPNAGASKVMKVITLVRHGRAISAIPHNYNLSLPVEDIIKNLLGKDLISVKPEPEPVNFIRLNPEAPGSGRYKPYPTTDHS